MAPEMVEPAKRILRVGYPATLSSELLSDFPKEIELIPLSDAEGPEIGIDVWIPDPYPTRAMRTWPKLRGVRLVLSLMAGTEWIPRTVGPHVTICNARGAHNISTAEWTIASILAMLKYFPFFLRFSAPASGSAASEPVRIMSLSAAIRGRSIRP